VLNPRKLVNLTTREKLSSLTINTNKLLSELKEEMLMSRHITYLALRRISIL